MARTVAVVTGASSGIGAVFARKLAAEHDLLLIARRQDKLEALAAELRAGRAQVEVQATDLASEPGLRAAAERIAAISRMGLLVNNAGFGSKGLFWEADLGEQGDAPAARAGDAAAVACGAQEDGGGERRGDHQRGVGGRVLRRRAAPATARPRAG